MWQEERIADFLARAKDAQEMAEKAKTESDKAEWLRIAAGYHALASHHEQKKS